MVKKFKIELSFSLKVFFLKEQYYTFILLVFETSAGPWKGGEKSLKFVLFYLKVQYFDLLGAAVEILLFLISQ